MVLVSIIALLLLDRLVEAKTDWRTRHAPEVIFRRWLELAYRGLPAWLARGLLWLLPAAIVAVIDYFAASWWDWLFAVAVLMLVVAPRHSQRINFELDQGCLAEDTELVSQARRVLFADSRYRPDAINARITGQRLVLLGYSEWFALLFWFVLLGPAGAVFYRSTEWLARLNLTDEPRRGWIKRCQQFTLGVLSVPASLVFAVLLMLAGSFQNSLQHWRFDRYLGFRHGARSWLEAYTLGLLARVGHSAIETEHKDIALDRQAGLSEQRFWYRAANAVQLRAQWFGLGLLALLLIAGWL
ncbi:MAG TPA: hypothetical protein ENM98_02225 [Halothiobacillaceae bacterium]|nr:hypothetical protein [Halothiobacillaceae bacterium]